MTRRRPTPLSRLRGRLWRLAALTLWVAVLVVNLAAAYDHPVQAAGFQPAICHSTGGDPSNPDAPLPDQAAAGHCAFCHIVAAAPLAPPAAVLVLVLAPPAGGFEPLSVALPPAPPSLAPFQAPPRAPPAFA